MSEFMLELLVLLDKHDAKLGYTKDDDGVHVYIGEESSPGFYDRDDLCAIIRELGGSTKGSSRNVPADDCLAPTHFVTCGGYSAFIVAPDATAEELSVVSEELHKMVDAAVNAHGGTVIIPRSRVYDLDNARNPDVYYGCYIVEHLMEAGRFRATIIPTQGILADAVAACEGHLSEHLTGSSLETLLTTVWWSEPLQRLYDGRFAPKPLSGMETGSIGNSCRKAR